MASKSLSAYLSEIGRKGGQVSGSRRMTNYTPEDRRRIALIAARARWAKRGRPVNTAPPQAAKPITVAVLRPKPTRVGPDQIITGVACRVCGIVVKPQHQHAKRGYYHPSPHVWNGGMCHGFAQRPRRYFSGDVEVLPLPPSQGEA